ncbi:hypothetical protein D3C76_1525430 [compost metagenome]
MDANCEIIADRSAVATNTVTGTSTVVVSSPSFTVSSYLYSPVALNFAFRTAWSSTGASTTPSPEISFHS